MDESSGVGISPVNPMQDATATNGGGGDAGNGGGDMGDNSDDDDTDAEEMKADPTAVPHVKVARDPGSPSKEEVNQHNCTHMPFRPWCEVCVESRGREDPHFQKRKKNPGEARDKPTVGLDYKTFGQAANEEDKVTMIVARDRQTKMTFAHVTDCKGPRDEWIVNRLVEDIGTLGHADVIIKTDGEPALVKVMEAMQGKRTHASIPEHPPAYDPQSNGAIEKAVDEVMGVLRCLKIGLERRIRTEIHARWPIVHWLVEHACTVINRYQVGVDGHTPFRRLTGKECQQCTVEIGEQIMAKPKRCPTANRKRSLRSKWVHGTWVGMC